MDGWNRGSTGFNNSGHRIMVSQQRPGMPTMASQNINHPQSFYRPANAQQFYPNTVGFQGNVGCPPGQAFARHMNPRPQQFRPVAPQAQVSIRMSQAEIENMRKKKQFEEQQRRLFALKERGGATAKKQLDNPLNDIFGKKAISSSASSLLGPLGNISKPTDVTASFPGSGQVVSNAGGGLASYRISNLPAAGTSPGPQVYNFQGTNVTPQTSIAPPTQDLGEFQVFIKADNDFGDFQQSTGNQLFGSTRTGLSQDSSSSSASAVAAAGQTMEKVSNSNMSDSCTSIVSTSSSNKEENVLPAIAAPSIEALMKKSLSFDKEPYAASVKFQKPKIVKQIKAQPKHFNESAKASKWDNLDALSEMFTIPQSSVAPPGDSQHQLPGNGDDDWSEFSGAGDGLFQEHSSQGQVRGSLHHARVELTDTLSNNQSAAASNPVATAVPTVPRPPRGSQGWSSSAAMQHGTQNVFLTQAITGEQSVTTRNNVLPDAAQVHDAQGQTEGSALADVDESPPVDPEQQTYGIQLPGWSNDTSKLPAVYKQIHEICSNGTGGISTSQLYPILLSSDLPRDKLGHIWSQCNKAVPGQLNDQELYLVLGMVALAQVGLQVNKLTLEKLASCTTAPIPSFPEKIFQNQNELVTTVPAAQTSEVSLDTKSAPNSETWTISDTTLDNNLSRQSTYPVNAVKQPDWSKWKTSKAGHVDDKFTDFQVIPKDRSVSFQGLGATVSTSTVNPPPLVSESRYSFASFQSSDLPAPNSTSSESSNGLPNILKFTAASENSSLSDKPKPKVGGNEGNKQKVFPEFQSVCSSSTNKDLTSSFGDFASSIATNKNTGNDFGDFTSIVPSTKDSTNTFGDFASSLGGLRKDSMNIFENFTGVGDSNEDIGNFGGFTSVAGTTNDSANAFGDFASSVGPNKDVENVHKNTTVSAGSGEKKSGHGSAHFMSVPLQASQRYTLSGEDESIDHHEKAWLKCLTSCFTVIKKSCEVLQTISNSNVMNEIFASEQGISHFSAIIEVYCVSQRIKASVLKSASNNKMLKESLQNIDNVWKTCLGFQPFSSLLPSQSLNFSGCHVNEDEDLNLTCGVCILNVDKSWITSPVNKGRSGKLSYGTRNYHTTCANFWCNKVDSVLPALQLNIGNSLI